ncbi:MAG: HNH endonuclease [Lachnospiraceae bacterium]|nr:HNH endonuclease [Lachnospiraceae bacterium]
MRIHGRHIIKRRTGLDSRSYPDYLAELREDFHYICGYCGKSERVTKKGFEIDHFIPQRLAEELRDNYNNLVYSCFTCNRKKGKKWPTENINLQHNDKQGFCDPATEEFDSHLQRDESGKIISCSAVGEYMLKKAFRFDKRPTDVIWKAMKIIDMKQELRSKWGKLTPEEKDEYMQVDGELDSLLSYIFEKKE